MSAEVIRAASEPVAHVLGVKERTAALALAAFLGPATAVAHGLWSAEGAELQPQLANFLKNVAIAGGRLFVAFRPDAARD
ncbi:MAG TPA: hypothetical protein VKF60_09720 [Myxococcota bacterium]|nr:hypothetical protein [Myxococcota bacterium]